MGLAESKCPRSETARQLQVEVFAVVDVNKSESLEEEELQDLVLCVTELNKVEAIRALREIVEKNDSRLGGSASGELTVSDIMQWFDKHCNAFTELDLKLLLAIAKKHRARRHWQEASSVKRLIHRLAVQDIEVENHPELNSYLRSSPRSTRLGSVHHRLALKALEPILKGTEQRHRTGVAKTLLNQGEIKISDLELLSV